MRALILQDCPALQYRKTADVLTGTRQQYLRYSVDCVTGDPAVLFEKFPQHRCDTKSTDRIDIHLYLFCALIEIIGAHGRGDRRGIEKRVVKYLGVSMLINGTNVISSRHAQGLTGLSHQVTDENALRPRLSDGFGNPSYQKV